MSMNMRHTHAAIVTMIVGSLPVGLNRRRTCVLALKPPLAINTKTTGEEPDRAENVTPKITAHIGDQLGGGKQRTKTIKTAKIKIFY